MRLLLLALLVPALAPAQRPDVVLTNGKIFTADSLHPWAEALAIRGDRIVAVGKTADIMKLAGPNTRTVALDGRVVIPGLNDAHDHLGTPNFGVSFTADPSPAPDPTFAAVVDSVRTIAARTPRGTWIHATVGARVFDDPSAGRTALDRVAPDHPVLLDGNTGHGVIANTRGLRALGIAENAHDVAGGKYERDAAGRLTGVLQEYAGWDALRRLRSSLPRAAVVASIRDVVSSDVRWGITSVQDMASNLDPATTFAALREAAVPIRVRVIPFPSTDTRGLRAGEWIDTTRTLPPRVTMSGVKWILDGTPIERGAFMRAAYADRPATRGTLDFPVDTIRAILRTALATREPLHLHVVGDSTAALVLALMQQLAPDSAWRPLRVRFEHGDGVSGRMLPIVKRLGIVIVQNPTHFAFSPGVRDARLGGTQPLFQSLHSIAAAGIHVAIGGDGGRNPFVNMMLAVSHPNNPSEGLTREQVVTAYTRGSAYAEFAEREKGMLAPGMLADLAVLSQDIFTVPPAALPATTSVLTLVGGKTVYDAKAGIKVREK